MLNEKIFQNSIFIMCVKMAEKNEMKFRAALMFISIGSHTYEFLCNLVTMELSVISTNYR